MIEFPTGNQVDVGGPGIEGFIEVETPWWAEPKGEGRRSPNPPTPIDFERLNMDYCRHLCYRGTPIDEEGARLSAEGYKKRILEGGGVVPVCACEGDRITTPGIPGGTVPDIYVPPEWPKDWGIIPNGRAAWPNAWGIIPSGWTEQPTEQPADHRIFGPGQIPPAGGDNGFSLLMASLILL